ncbi:MAG: DmsE family decaheme c-type cytochrome [Elusimicrobia bacterium]|nr:DmsE family decaheme c-type cytochrome [Elusimicrobiota bacterium]
MEELKMRNPRTLISLLAAAGVLGAAVSLRAAETAAFVGAETCAGCHAEVAEKFAKTFHGRKAKSSDKLKAGCESCHGPGSLHAAAGGDKNNPGFATIKNLKNLSASEQSAACLTCHKDAKQLMMWKTGSHATNDVSCLKCHSVHAGEGRKSLAARSQGETETCLKCHRKQKADMNLASHHPVPEGKMFCTSCHNPHGGIEGNLKADSLEELCGKCHSEKLGPFAFEHSPVADGCNNCHVVHGSSNDRLLVMPQPAICTTCHWKPHSQNAAAPGTIARISGKVRCTDCHMDIHGSDYQKHFKP